MYETPFQSTRTDSPERGDSTSDTSTHFSPEHGADPTRSQHEHPHQQEQYTSISQDPTIPIPRIHPTITTTTATTNANATTTARNTSGDTIIMEELQRDHYLVTGKKFRSLLDRAFRKVASGYSEAIVVQNEELLRMDMEEESMGLGIEDGGGGGTSGVIGGGRRVIGMETRSGRKRPLETNTNGGSTNWNSGGEGRRDEDYKPLTRRRLDLALGPTTRNESSYDEGNTKYASELVREKIKEIMVLKRVSVTHTIRLVFSIVSSPRLFC
jgi:hypothetical protein